MNETTIENVYKIFKGKNNKLDTTALHEFLQYTMRMERLEYEPSPSGGERETELNEYLYSFEGKWDREVERRDERGE